MSKTPVTVIAAVDSDRKSLNTNPAIEMHPVRSAFMGLTMPELLNLEMIKAYDQPDATENPHIRAFVEALRALITSGPKVENIKALNGAAEVILSKLPDAFPGATRKSAVATITSNAIHHATSLRIKAPDEIVSKKGGYNPPEGTEPVYFR